MTIAWTVRGRRRANTSKDDATSPLAHALTIVPSAVRRSEMTWSHSWPQEQLT
jgi:hypothetical protein